MIAKAANAAATGATGLVVGIAMADKDFELDRNFEGDRYLWGGLDFVFSSSVL